MPLSKVFVVFVAVTAIAVQSARPGALSRVIPRPPAPPPGANNAEAGSAAPDGYAPIPQWAGQTRAPHPARSEELFSRDGGDRTGWRLLVPLSARPAASSSASAPAASASSARTASRRRPWRGCLRSTAAAHRGCSRSCPNRDFAKNRTLYFDYTALPPGTDPAKAPRLAGVLQVARAATGPTTARALEDVKTILNAEGIGGRMIQAADGTMLVTSGVPAGVGIDWSIGRSRSNWIA